MNRVDLLDIVNITGSVDNTITKKCDGFQISNIYSNNINQGNRNIKRNKKGTGDRVNNKIKGIYRAKNKIKDYALANDWSHFVTITLDKNKVDRYDYKASRTYAKQQMKNFIKRYAKGSKYLLVPDTHKDGAYHFHGLMILTDTTTLKESGLKDKQGRAIFNATKGIKGFNSFIRLDAVTPTDRLKMALYVTKYITKTLYLDTFGSQRYLVSNGIEQPSIEKSYTSVEQLEGLLIEKNPNKVEISKFTKSFTTDGNISEFNMYQIIEEELPF